MKRLILILIALSAHAAQAFGPETSWEKIFKTKQVILTFDENLGGIALSNACIAGNEIRTIKPVEHCNSLTPVRYQEGTTKWTNWECSQSVFSEISYPRITVTEVCHHWVDEDDNLMCARGEKVPVKVEQTIDVLVAKGYGTTSTWPGFKKQFTFPDCE